MHRALCAISSKFTASSLRLIFFTVLNVICLYMYCTYALFYAGKDNPTLMHVACRYGMEKLCSRLIDSLCLPESINITNKDNKRPCDLARENGHSTVADAFANQLVSFLIPYLCCVIFLFLWLSHHGICSPGEVILMLA